MATEKQPYGIPVFSCGPDSEHHIKRCMYLHVRGKLLVALEEGLLDRTRERRFPCQLGVLKLLMIFSTVLLVINVFYTVSYVTSMFGKLTDFGYLG
jgi:hypothetical protein